MDIPSLSNKVFKDSPCQKAPRSVHKKQKYGEGRIGNLRLLLPRGNAQLRNCALRAVSTEALQRPSHVAFWIGFKAKFLLQDQENSL